MMKMKKTLRRRTSGTTSVCLFLFVCFFSFPPLPKTPPPPPNDHNTKNCFCLWKKEIFNFKILNVNVLSICCIFLLPSCLFINLCNTSFNL